MAAEVVDIAEARARRDARRRNALFVMLAAGMLWLLLNRRKVSNG